jgi:RNA polymerase sigma-70 factor (ECF subfamily)
MPYATTSARHSLRSAADQLESVAARGGFRRRSQLDRSIDSDPMVPQAVARAKAGDSDAVRYLYLRYSDHVY